MLPPICKEGQSVGRSDGHGARTPYTKSTRQIHVHIPTSHHHKYGESECEMDIYICHFCVRDLFHHFAFVSSSAFPFVSLLICTLVCCFIVYNTYTQLNRNTIAFSVCAYVQIGVLGDSKNHLTNLKCTYMYKTMPG